MSKKLIQLSVGSLSEAAETNETDSDTQLDRKAMLVYAGEFESMDGPVAVTDEHIDQLAANHNSLLSKVSRLVTGDLPAKYCPPVQLDHSTSATMTVGRLVGPLEVGEYEDEDGSRKKALYGKLRILGRENVEKVKDGRWTHLSIGADLESGKVNELTITPFPAAKNAAMLSGSKKTTGETTMTKLADWKVVKTKGPWSLKIGVSDDGRYAYKIMKNNRDVRYSEFIFKSKEQVMAQAERKFESAQVHDSDLSQGETMDREKLKKHLMDTTKCSAEEAEEKLGAMTDEEMTKMASDVDEHEKQLAAEESDKKAVEMAAKKADAIKLMKAIKADQSKVALKARTSKISARLMALRAEAKITPAEIKKIDLVKLAGQNDATVDAVLSSYAEREPVIPVGMYGSKNAEELAKIAKLSEKRALERETLSNMTFTKKATAGQRLAEGGEQEGAQDTVSIHVDTDPHTDLTGYEQMKKLMIEGKDDEAKALWEKMTKMEESSPAVMKDHETSMTELASDLVTMQNQIDSLARLVSSELSITETDLQ